MLTKTICGMPLFPEISRYSYEISLLVMPIMDDFIN